MVQYKKAFTLIELLVVVLVIGILTAVVVPQYQKAVAKSRLAAVKPILAALKLAEEVHFLENGSYTGMSERLDKLNIDISCSYVDSGNAVRCEKYFMIDLISGNSGLAAWNIRAAYCPQAATWIGGSSPCNTTYDFMYTVWLDHSAKPGMISCSGRTYLGKSVCKGLE